jgi:hypothetical protein
MDPTRSASTETHLQPHDSRSNHKTVASDNVSACSDRTAGQPRGDAIFPSSLDSQVDIPIEEKHVFVGASKKPTLCNSVCDRVLTNEAEHISPTSCDIVGVCENETFGKNGLDAVSVSSETGELLEPSSQAGHETSETTEPLPGLVIPGCESQDVHGSTTDELAKVSTVC